jgi:hypothetical protein
MLSCFPSSAPLLLLPLRPAPSLLPSFRVATLALATRSFSTFLLTRRPPTATRPTRANLSTSSSHRSRGKMATVQPQWNAPPVPVEGATIPSLKLWNSLTRSKVDFVPLELGKVSWYSCMDTRKVLCCQHFADQTQAVPLYMTSPIWATRATMSVWISSEES